MLKNKVILTCAPTGAETTRAEHPGLPFTPEEVAETAVAAREAGAGILHLHVRDENGISTQNPETFRKVIDAVRKQTDIVIEISTGGAVGDTPEDRLRPVFEVMPEMASLDCGSVNFGNEYIVNTLPMMREFAAAFEKCHVQPTLECFDPGQIASSRQLIKEGLLKPPFFYGLAFNIRGAMPYSQASVDAMLRQLPEDADFTLVGIGRAQLPCQYLSLAIGGQWRVGFEDNIYYHKGVLAENNAQLVARATRLIREAGMEPATPAEIREYFKLSNY